MKLPQKSHSQSKFFPTCLAKMQNSCVLLVHKLCVHIFHQIAPGCNSKEIQHLQGQQRTGLTVQVSKHTRSLGCFATILAISSSNSLGQTDPVGLDGEQRISSLVFSVSLDSSSFGSKRKFSDIEVGRITGVASASLAISG